MKYRIFSWFKYFLHARHRGGHGIHSPFLFRFITEVIEDKTQYPEYQLFKKVEKKVFNQLNETLNTALAEIFDLNKLNPSQRKRCYYRIEIPKLYAKVIFRIIRDFNPEKIIFLGPSLGVNVAVIRCAASESEFHYIFDSMTVHNMIRENLKIDVPDLINYDNEISTVNFDSSFIILNYPHNQTLTDQYLQIFIQNSFTDKILIIRGIHNSVEMEVLWERVRQAKEVNVTIDLFEIGIVIIRKASQKENFILRF